MARFLLVLALCSFAAAEKVRYDGFHLLTVGPFKTIQQVQDLQEHLKNDHHARKVIYWSDARGLEPIDFVVSPDLAETTMAYLKKQGITFKLLNRDIQSWINEEARANMLAKSAEQMNEEPVTYKDYDEVVTWVQSIVSQFSNLASFEYIGNTYENRQMIMMKLSSGGSNKPGVFIDCGIHAREWISPATCLWMVHRLLNTYGSDAESTTMLNDFDWYVVPVANPDGYAYTHSTDRLWRKTRQPTSDPFCTGADPNRNYATGWDAPEGGNSDDPCSETYRGSAPFSEPSQAALSNTMLRLKNNLEVFVSIHSYTQLWLLPYGYTVVYPPDYDILETIGLATADSIFAVNGLSFTVGTPPDILYTAAGISLDWGYDPQGANITYSFSPELRPSSAAEGGFIIGPENIRPSGQEIYAGMVTKLRLVKEQIGKNYY